MGVAASLFRDQHDLGLDDAGIADQRTSGLDQNLRQLVTEMPGDRRHHGPGIAIDRRHIAAIMRREPAADIHHTQLDIRLGEQ